MDKTAQQEFDEMYITSSEITEMLDISRSSLLRARRRGQLPQPIMIGSTERPAVVFWRRIDVAGILQSWKKQLSGK